MILLHRLGSSDELMVNPDIIVSAEATPDTVVVLATGARLIVAESPEEVAQAVHRWRASVLAAGRHLAVVT
jgi:flagellar protein FlbD